MRAILKMRASEVSSLWLWNCFVIRIFISFPCEYIGCRIVICENGAIILWHVEFVIYVQNVYGTLVY